MDFLIDVLLEIYMELMFLIVPEDKRTKKHLLWVKLIAVAVMLGIFALAVWGLVWIIDDKNAWGWLPLGVAILFSVIQITAGILLFIRRNRK